MILIDTGIIFDFFTGHDNAEYLEIILKEAKVSLSVITIYELFNGVENKKHILQREEFIKLCNIIDLTMPIVRKASEIYTILKKTGKLICNEDIIIAATAIYKKYPLYSINKNHFKNITGLVLY